MSSVPRQIPVQSKYYDKIDICYFSAKHTTLYIKSKDWLDQSHHNMSELCEIFSYWLWASTIKIQLSTLVKCKTYYHCLTKKYLGFVMICSKAKLWMSWHENLYCFYCRFLPEVIPDRARIKSFIEEVTVSYNIRITSWFRNSPLPPRWPVWQRKSPILP